MLVDYTEYIVILLVYIFNANNCIYFSDNFHRHIYGIYKYLVYIYSYITRMIISIANAETSYIGIILYNDCIRLTI